MPANVENYVQRSNYFLKINWELKDISTIGQYYYKIGTGLNMGDVSQSFSEAGPGGWVPIESIDYEVDLTISEPGYIYAD